jgi:hypothetical protein
MGKWQCGAYIAVMSVHFLIHSWSWAFALRAAFWIFVGGSGVITLFAELCRRASTPQPAIDYLGKDGQVRMPLAVNVLRWSAYAVLLAGSALILVGFFYTW